MDMSQVIRKGKINCQHFHSLNPVFVVFQCWPQCANLAKVGRMVVPSYVAGRRTVCIYRDDACDTQSRSYLAVVVNKFSLNFPNNQRFIIC